MLPVLVPAGVPVPTRAPSRAGRLPGGAASVGRARGQSRLVERVGNGGQVVDVGVDGVQTEAHRDDRNMAATCLPPGVDLCREAADTAVRKRHVIGTEALGRPAQAVNAIAQPFPGSDGIAAAAEEDEAVREASGPVERLLTESTEPDRDGPRRLR